jgi:hypothetical protein
MRRLIPLGLGIVLLTVFILGCQNNDANHANLTVDVAAPYMGTLLQNEVKAYDFTFTNRSDSSILIDHIEKTCTCTNFSFSTPEIASHGQLKLKVTVDALNRIGLFYTKLIVYWKKKNSLDIHHIDLNISGTSKPLALVNPGNVDFGTVQSTGAIIRTEIRIRQDNSTARWNSLAASSKHLGLLTTRSDGDYVIGASFNPGLAAIGLFHDSILVTLSKGELGTAHDFQVPVFARVIGPLEATPPSIYLGAVRQNVTVRGSILLRSTAGQSLAGLPLEIKHGPHISCSYSNRNTGAIAIDYAFVSSGPPGDQSAPILIKAIVNSKPIVLAVPLLVYIVSK